MITEVNKEVLESVEVQDYVCTPKIPKWKCRNLSIFVVAFTNVSHHLSYGLSKKDSILFWQNILIINTIFRSYKTPYVKNLLLPIQRLNTGQPLPLPAQPA